jgi:CheY-like chemotaxis protein
MLNATPKVVAVLDDLFFTVKIMDAVKRAGLELELLKDEPTVLDRAAASPTLMIFDLNIRSLNAVEVIQKIKQSRETRHVSILGFVSHVQVDLKARAQQAGADVVLPRSTFSTNLPAILQRHADALSPE